MPTPDSWYRDARRVLSREQGTIWPEMAEFRCPPCAIDSHWNHVRADGGCNTHETVSRRDCECTYREHER